MSQKEQLVGSLPSTLSSAGFTSDDTSNSVFSQALRLEKDRRK